MACWRATNEFIIAQLVSKLLDLFILYFDKINKHLTVLLVITNKWISVKLDILKLFLLELNDLSSVSLFHLNLGLTKSLVFVVILQILVLQKGDALVQHRVRVILCTLLGGGVVFLVECIELIL